MATAVVVGGGISGLTAAWELTDAGFTVTVVESAPRWGGKIGSTAIDGVRLDTGAESVLARRPEGIRLIADLGLGPDQVHPTGAQPRLLIGGRLVRLPPSVVGVPTGVAGLADLLSAAGLRRAQELNEDTEPVRGDVAIGQLLDQRLGPEVTDRLLEPLLGGIYAGRSRELSFDAVAHALFGQARQPGRITDHAQAVARPGAGPVFAGLVGGVSRLIDALVAQLRDRGADLRLNVGVRAVEPEPGGFGLTVVHDGTTRRLRADAVVLAVPASAVGRLAPPGPAVDTFAQIPYASVAVLTVVVQGADQSVSGLLIPPGEQPTIKAVTHSTTKWDWVAEQARSVWGPDVGVVRLSIGRLGEEALLQLGDGALVDRTWAEAQTLPGWSGAQLLQARLARWGGALPQYRVGHRGLVADLRSALAPVRGLAVAGAALDGVGIAACLASAQTAVAKITADLGADRGEMEVRAGRSGDPQEDQA